MTTYEIVVTQSLTESSVVEVEADSLEDAKAIVQDSIDRDAFEEEFDPDWSGEYCFNPHPGFQIDEEESNVQ